MIHAAPPWSRIEPAVSRFLPQSLGSLFDSAFDIYKRRFAMLALVVSLLYIPAQILMHALMTTWLLPMLMRLNDPTAPPDIFGSFLAIVGLLFVGVPKYGVPGLVSLGALVLVSGAITVIVSDIYLGREPSVSAAFRVVRRHAFRLLMNWTLIGLALFGVLLGSFLFTFTLTIIFAAILSGHIPDEVISFIVLFGFISPYFVGCALIAKWFCLTTPLLVLERQPLLAAPTRNSDLVSKSRFRRVWGAMIFLPLVTLGIQFLMLLSVSSSLQALPLSPLWSFVAEIACATGISLFFQPYWMIFLTLAYFDFRIRREGLDMFILVADLPAAPPVALAVPQLPEMAAPPARPTPPILPPMPSISRLPTFPPESGILIPPLPNLDMPRRGASEADASEAVEPPIVTTAEAEEGDR